MKIQMVDLSAGYAEIRNEIEIAIKKILDKTNFILGEEVEKFEKEFANFCGTKYAVGVASGTDALKIAMTSCGIKKGEEVITTPFTFIATSEAVHYIGASIIFADIEPDTYNIDPKEIEKKITPRTRAILPVHLYGHCADMDNIMKLARKHNLFVIEDCAQAFTAKYKLNSKEWHYSGSMGNAGCFSFFPAKNLGAFGDGGMIITDDEKVFENAKCLRNHGGKTKYYYDMHGFNSRLDTIQAAILSVKLKHVEKWTKKRQEAAEKYNRLLKDVAIVPMVKENCVHSFNYYTIRLKNKEIRDNVHKYLSENGISSQFYYPLSLHLQAAHKELGYQKGDFPVSEKIQDETLALPMYPELTDDKINLITETVKKALKLIYAG